MNTMPLEEDTRHLINISLTNLGWNLSGNNKNVYFEQAKTEKEKKKLKGKRPDFVLYPEKSDIPLIVIEAKRRGGRIDSALEQGIGYAKAIGAPLVFATDGVFCKSFHTGANCTPLLNGEEVDEFIRESLALKFLNTYEVNTIRPEVQYSRRELIKIFEDANNMLRGEGLRAGIERFGEFANILFLKLISEIEEIKEDSGEESKFDKLCSWESIKKIPQNAKIEYINNTVYKRLNQLYHTEIFTPLAIRNERILTDIMDKLDPLMLTDVDSDIKGDAFEYFLKASTATKNDLGEYFTPRHIVKTMVRLINPQIGEKIYDPFCGTGGFLIESFRYIYDRMARNERNLNLLKDSTVYGNEITNTARITKMNMILAGDGHSNIEMKDSLANPVDGTEKGCGYDVVITNMPYSQKTNYSSLYDLPSKNGDSICVQHCIKAVSRAAENGRIAIVVPEGFLFRKDLKKTREYLLNRCQLQSIISLPQGVFLPYTDVKTDIIYATRVNQRIKSSERSGNFWYFDVKNDGYTLDNHRRKLDTQSDLSRYEEYRKLDKEQKKDMLKVGFEIIPLEKVKKNDYILAGGRYREINDLSKYKTLPFADIAKIIRGVHYQKSQQNVFRTGKVVLTADNVTLSGELSIKKEIFISADIPDEKRLKKNDIFICMSSGSKEHIGKVAYLYEDTCYYAGGFMGIVRVFNNECLPQYLYFYMLYCQKFKEEIKLLSQGANINNISNMIQSIRIPLPEIEIQEKISKELCGYQQIIFEAQKIKNSYIPYINIGKWNTSKLSDLFVVISKNINPKEKEGIVNFIGLENIEAQTGEIVGKTKYKFNEIKSAKRIFEQGDILFGKLRPALNKVTVAPFSGICSTDIIVLRPRRKNILADFYAILMRRKEFNDMVLNGVNGGQLPRVNVDYLLNLSIHNVPLDEQRKILDQIQAERDLIHPMKNIVKLFTEKIERKVEEIWGK